MQSAPNGSVFILHTCAHNPTGVDPTIQQWEAILDVIQAKGHLPFFDTAYQVCLSNKAFPLSPALNRVPDTPGLRHR